MGEHSAGNSINGYGAFGLDCSAYRLKTYRALRRRRRVGFRLRDLDKFTELAKIPAMKGKTWKHPVLAGDVLLARNGQEMVVYRVTLGRR